MRRILLATSVLLYCLSSTPIWAQDCKPNLSQKDKISKAQQDYWVVNLVEPGIGSALLSTAQVYITASIGRSGAENRIQVQISKQEGSAVNASAVSAYEARAGDPFHFGMKDGQSLKFAATDVINQNRVHSGLFSGKLVTTVLLSTVLTDNELATLRDVLSQKQIDAVRITLKGDVLIEDSVKDKNGAKMMEKVGCFFENGWTSKGLIPLPLRQMTSHHEILLQALALKSSPSRRRPRRK